MSDQQVDFPEAKTGTIFMTLQCRQIQLYVFTIMAMMIKLKHNVKLVVNVLCSPSINTPPVLYTRMKTIIDYKRAVNMQ